MKLFAPSLLLILLFFNACSEPPFDPAMDNILKIDAGKPKLLISKDKLKRSILKANKDFKSIDVIKTELIGSENHYLIAHGKMENDKTIFFAIQLVPSDEEKHFRAKQDFFQFCIGSCCSSCGFLIEDNKITGCSKCKEEEQEEVCKDKGHCNHNISTGLGMAKVS